MKVKELEKYADEQILEAKKQIAVRDIRKLKLDIADIEKQLENRKIRLKGLTEENVESIENHRVARYLGDGETETLSNGISIGIKAKTNF